MAVAVLHGPGSSASEPAAQIPAASHPLAVAPADTTGTEPQKPRVALPAAKAATAPSAPRQQGETPAQNDLRALEDQALRQIDVMPILRAAGIDAAALEARSDGNDLLRHIAADELMTRSIMHDLLRNTIYPYGYSRDQALADARAAADRMVAAMIPEARADLLEQALTDGSSSEPEPTFYGADSGRVVAAEGAEAESPTN
ncbi:MAG TPA: hypothetical protein VMR50_02400 [Myxococcota bacterium]|nr:hypothetical protein [Myxococcota bacterium]